MSLSWVLPAPIWLRSWLGTGWIDPFLLTSSSKSVCSAVVVLCPSRPQTCFFCYVFTFSDFPPFACPDFFASQTSTSMAKAERESVAPHLAHRRLVYLMGEMVETRFGGREEIEVTDGRIQGRSPMASSPPSLGFDFQCPASLHPCLNKKKGHKHWR